MTENYYATTVPEMDESNLYLANTTGLTILMSERGCERLWVSNFETKNKNVSSTDNDYGLHHNFDCSRAFVYQSLRALNGIRITYWKEP